MLKAVWLAIFCLLSLGFGQDVRLELGFRGEMVAEHWNPLRLIRRDMGPATLTLEFDQGTLREGQILVRYQVQLKAAQGLDVFEDDVYIPLWRSLVWKLADDKTVFASGSFDRQLANPQPIDLVISKTPETYLTTLGENHRIVQGDDLLPERLAAYDGVHVMVLDGSVPMPSLEAISTAVAAGVKVFWIDEANQYPYDMLGLLAPVQRQRLGAGWLIRTKANGLKASIALLPELDLKALQNATFSPQPMPATIPSSTLLAALGIYVLLVLLSIRFMGNAGLITAFLFTGFACFALWNYLRVPPQIIHTQALYLNAGKLAQVSSFYQVTQLPEQQLELVLQARPESIRSYTQGETLVLKLARWSQENLILKPWLSTASLLLEGNTVTNQSNAAMNEIYVSGLGQQQSLAPGQSLTLTPGEESNLYEAILPMLPLGTVIARQNQDWHIAIPGVDGALP